MTPYIENRQDIPQALPEAQCKDSWSTCVQAPHACATMLSSSITGVTCFAGRPTHDATLQDDLWHHDAHHKVTTRSPARRLVCRQSSLFELVLPLPSCGAAREEYIPIFAGLRSRGCVRVGLILIHMADPA